MQNDLISRSALIKDIRFTQGLIAGESDWLHGYVTGLSGAIDAVTDAPAVDAVELPKGRPGGYLEWDNGVGHRQIYAILSVMICKDCIRYELADFAPVVNHKGIVRILSPEEVEKMVKERGKAWKYMWCEYDNKAANGTEG